MFSTTTTTVGQQQPNGGMASGRAKGATPTHTTTNSTTTSPQTTLPLSFTTYTYTSYTPSPTPTTRLSVRPQWKAPRRQLSYPPVPGTAPLPARARSDASSLALSHTMAPPASPFAQVTATFRVKGTDGGATERRRRKTPRRTLCSIDQSKKGGLPKPKPNCDTSRWMPSSPTLSSLSSRDPSPPLLNLSSAYLPYPRGAPSITFPSPSPSPFVPFLRRLSSPALPPVNGPVLSFLLLLLSLSSLSLPHLVAGLPASINLGAIFTPDRRDQEYAFRLAISRLNEDNLLKNSKLVAKIEHIEQYDSFHGNKKVCGLLREGVVAIFDPFDGHISHHIQSICDAMEIPHIETRWEFKSPRNDLSINMYPRPTVLARAYVDIVKAWSWEQFVIVYEDSEGLFRLQDFFKEAQSRNWRIKLHQFEPGKPYRETFWKIKDDGETNIILDVKSENIFRALKHAQQVGLITEQHSYLITQLDLHTIDLEDFKFGKTKITAFSLIDNSTEKYRLLMNDWKSLYPENFTGQISTEAALIYDSVKLLVEALKDLDNSQKIDRIAPIDCDNSNTNGWGHGTSLINFMRPVSIKGVTGIVSFNEFGARSQTTLRIVTVSPEGLEEIGTWREDGPAESRLNITKYWTSHTGTSALQNKTLIITTILNDPYTMIKDSSFKRTGNDQFEGYAIDLIAALAKLLHFKYEFRLVKDRSYGRPDKNGTWNGMMGELIRGEADLAVADLTITSKREDAVDFTHPYMNTGISILFKKPTKKVTSLFSFLSPFSNTVWIYVLCAYIGVSSILFVVGRLSPYEWENPHPCRQDEQVLENGFSLSNSFWFTIGSLMQQASDLTPKAMSTRTIAAIWYFFTLIMIASYTANLAAFLTVEKIVYPIENAEGLSSQEKIKYGCLSSGSTASFFSESNITTYKRMWEFMSKNKEVFMKSNEEGKKTVEKADGAYAYLMESASIEYNVERNCNLTQIGGLLDSKGYGVAAAKDSPYRMPLSQAILQLQESGELLILKERWWKQRKGGGQCIDDSKKGSGTVMPLKIDNVGGVFVVLLGGLSFSLFVVILEFVWKARSDFKQESVCEEMIHDLKFALMCQSSSKFVSPGEPHSPVSESGRTHPAIEYYPPAHFRRGGGHYPPVPAPLDPYSLQATPVTPKRIYGMGANGVTSTTTVYSTTPKSGRAARPTSRLGGLSNQSPGPSHKGVPSDMRPLTDSSHHLPSSRLPFYHFDDCALANSNSALNFGSSGAVFTKTGGATTGGSAQNSARQSLRSVQYALNGNSASVNTGMAIPGKSSLRQNGSRNNSQKRSILSGAAQMSAAQSNSCTDLVRHEVTIAGHSSGGGVASVGGGGGGIPGNGVHRTRSGNSMRSIGKSNQYLHSFDDERTNSMGVNG